MLASKRPVVAPFSSNSAHDLSGHTIISVSAGALYNIGGVGEKALDPTRA
jgi:hypothetical protein